MSNLNINLNEGQKKRYTINGDESRVLEFNPTDLGMLTRINEIEPEIMEKLDQFSDMQDKADYTDDKQVDELAKGLKELDTFIRAKLDYLFDTNFSEVCAPSGTMLDPVGEGMRFTYLIDVFSDLFGDEISNAVQKRNKQIKKHTTKYTNKVK